MSAAINQQQEHPASHAARHSNQSNNNGGNNANKPAYLQVAAVGFMALLFAMLANADSVQNLEANGLMPLSLTMNNQTQAYSDAWISQMNKDLAQLQTDSADNGPVSEDTAKFNQDNTMYNQANSFWGGITNGLNTSVSNTESEVSLVFQEIGQNTLQIQSTITSVV
jgi:hypothetical protein